ncbi:WhiB family transcriptional regulator [Streptomyces sp. NPDC058251]|uniref:WhiB family transcriptional regulator n=1 Tax=unclassified Streptomyces TaxID=2593676 RepID=UPI003648062D
MTRRLCLSELRKGRRARAVPRRSTAPWVFRGACRDVESELFFPEGEQSSGHEEKAKGICASCPVTQQCLMHAQSVPERFGVWGGKTARERGWDKHGAA